MPKNKPLRVILGENVALLVERKNLNQSKVAAEAKKGASKGLVPTSIDQTTVSRVMRAGKHNATKEESSYPTTVDTIEAIAYGLDVPAFRLLVPSTYDEKLLAILQAWSVTSEVGRDLMLSVARVAIEKYGEDSREGERRA